MNKANLLAIKVERRKVAAVFFRGLEVEHTEVRHLPANTQEAVVRATAFISWVIASSEPSMMAMVRLVAPEDPYTQREIISAEIVQVLRQAGVPIWDVEKAELLKYYGSPLLVSSRQLREVGRRIWPTITGINSSALLEAAAVGLFVQVKRQYGADG